MYQQGWKLDEQNGRIRICKKWYKYFKSRNIEGKVKTVTVKRDGLGDIYIYLTCEIQRDTAEPRTGEIVGFDFGLKKFLTASNGQDIKSPDFFALNSKIIHIKSRNFFRKKKASNNRERAYRELIRAYRKMFRQRTDFHFKTARKLCEQYTVICLETLDLQAIGKRHGRKINSLAFYEFVQTLLCEASKTGTRIIFLDRYYPSSQLCHVCGFKNTALKDERIRSWDCPSCGTHHDRDRNAAMNILRAGVSALGGEPLSAARFTTSVDSAGTVQ